MAKVNAQFISNCLGRKQTYIGSLCFGKEHNLKAYLKAGFHLNECNDSAEAARVGACVVGSNVDSPAADLGRIG